MTKTFNSLSDLASAFGKSIDDNAHQEVSHDENLVYSTADGRISQSKSVAVRLLTVLQKFAEKLKGEKVKVLSRLAVWV